MGGGAGSKWKLLSQAASLKSGCWGGSQGFRARERTHCLAQSPKLSSCQDRAEKAVACMGFSIWGPTPPTKEDRASKNPSPLLGESPLVTISIFGVSQSNQILRLGSAHSGIYRLLEHCFPSILINPDTAWKPSCLGRGRGEMGALKENGHFSLRGAPGAQIGESIPTRNMCLPQVPCSSTSQQGLV